MKYLGCLLVVAYSLAASAAFAETSTLLRKPQPNMSIRMAQRSCLEGNHKCCCDRTGPLCCDGYECVVRNNVGYCQPKEDDDE